MVRRAKSPPKSRARKAHYRNDAFLAALGEHCRALRISQGYSIDRMAKESDQLSSSVIYRLESGSGPVTVSALYRFAQVLELHPKALFDFPVAGSDEAGRGGALVPIDDPRVKREAFKTLLPVYTLRAAAGYFGAGKEIECEGWIEIRGERKLDRKMFVARAAGTSMEPKIHDGDLLVFRADPVGTRQGKIVLAQYRGPADPETGGSFTVKRYGSVKTVGAEGEWRHRRITLSPLNPAFEPIHLEPRDESDFRVLAEYLFTVE